MGTMRLGVNIDHVATLRQARRGRLPDPVEAARICEQAGASHIVCHLREDRRHIQDDDVWRLKRILSTSLNLEMSIAPDIVQVALALKPHWVTLVPERRQELTTEGGLDVIKHFKRLQRVIRSFHQQGIPVSLFVDPLSDSLLAARDLGVSMVELHSGGYAEARHARRRLRTLGALRVAARRAHQLGLWVAAGHGLGYDNVRRIARIGEIQELNIGYSIIIRAVFVGLEQAVREMVSLLSTKSPHSAPDL